MNKKEVAEIKKLFKPEMCNLTRICGCYVDSEKYSVIYICLKYSVCIRFHLLRQAQ